MLVDMRCGNIVKKKQNRLDIPIRRFLSYFHHLYLRELLHC